MRRKFVIIGILIGMIVLYSTLFRFLMKIYEGKTITQLDAVFWTISTLTTLGEGFAYLQYRSPVLQILSIVVQFSGIAIIYGVVSLIVIPYLKENILMRLPEKAPRKMKNHIIICRYSEIVDNFLKLLKKQGVRFLIIEKNASIARRLYDRNYLVIYGDPKFEQVLNNANLEDAKLVIANGSDEENASITLTASSLGKDTLVILEDLTKAKYFKYAGAKKIISPKNLLGATMGREACDYILKNLFGIVDFFGDIKMASFRVEENSRLVGKKIKDSGIRKKGCVIVGIKKGEKLKLNPPPDEVIDENSILIAIGKFERLRELGKSKKIGHVIMVGYGDVGRLIATHLNRMGINFVVIDVNKEKLEETEFNYVVGDGTKERTLEEAKIKEASLLLTCLDEDIKNIYVTLIAKKINPRLVIFSRVNSPENVEKAYKAGADYVFCLCSVAGEMLVKSILSPEKNESKEEPIKLPEGGAIYRYKVTDTSPLAWKTLEDSKIRERTGCIVIGIKRDSEIIKLPEKSEVTPPGSTILLFGSAENINRFIEYFT